MKTQTPLKKMRRWGLLVVGSLLGVLNPSQSEPVEGASLGGPSHIGTFEGSTTFATSSSNGINPGLYLEVMDKYGNYTEYTSEDGIITIPNTTEGAYVTQAKLLGKTKYRDQDTGELLDQWEAGRRLTLESVQRPVLKATGKNLFDGKFTKYNNMYGLYYFDNGVYTYSITDNDVSADLSGVAFGDAENGSTSINWLINSGSVYGDKRTITNRNLVFYPNNEETFNKIKQRYNIQIEQGSVATSYEPYKTNILSTSEDVELRGIGNVRDELDLLTGEVTERIGEVVLDGSENWVNSDNDLTNTHRFSIALPDFKSSGLLFNDGGFKNITSGTSSDDTKNIQMSGTSLYLRIDRSVADDVFALKDYLSKNNLTVYGELTENSIKTVGLNSTYSFQPVMNRDVYISGNILPLVCSVTIPTEPLTFVLNPNAEADQQFIAPEFTITNHTPTSIYLEVSRFEQLTQVLTDVLPEAHEDWSQLDRAQSKEIALALVPKPSEGWLSLEEGPRYVAADSNYYLGEVKANSSVDFTFTAHHGRAFVEALNPQYRLSFVFDFFDR